MLGKIEIKRRKGWQRIWLLTQAIDSMDMKLSKLWEIVETEKPGVQQCKTQ